MIFLLTIELIELSYSILVKAYVPAPGVPVATIIAPGSVTTVLVGLFAQYGSNPAISAS